MESRRLIILILVLFIGCTMPVMGVDTYLGSAPQMSASISGVNEFTPG
jgi:hypothetical protein